MTDDLTDAVTALVAGLVFGIVLGYGIFCFLIRLSSKARAKDAAVGKGAGSGGHTSGRPRIQVVVIGDIGRSPRMQYHALSLARHGCRVDLVGYLESPLHPGLQNNEKVEVHALPSPPKALSSLPFIIAAPVKVALQTISLGVALVTASRPSYPEWIIVQNPPSIPALHVAYMAASWLGCKILVDWHNYGWSILATTRGARHPFVKMYCAYERYWGGSCATSNLTVTDAMARDLRGPAFGVAGPTHTLHDRPAAHFQPIQSSSHRKETLGRLEPTSSQADAIMEGTTRLVVSSTSWTPDEDFGMLLDALVGYAELYKESQKDSGPSDQMPRVMVVVTGRGPQKAKYEALVQDLTRQGRLAGVDFSTAWLSIEDYAALLACADLGVCLHTSSSGVDLPMKVVDMFGTGLPVVAYGGYKSFGELVKEGVNGRGFTTAAELAESLAALLPSTGKEELVRLKEGAIQEGSLRWDEEWDRVVAKELGI